MLCFCEACRNLRWLHDGEDGRPLELCQEGLLLHQGAERMCRLGRDGGECVIKIKSDL